MNNTDTKILIFGAGIIGSIYAKRFIQSGLDVTILARGERLRQLQENGLQYDEKGTLKTVSVKVIEKLENDDIYDFIIVAVRHDQMEGALSDIHENESKTIVTLSNAVTYDSWISLVGERLLPAFPGAGGDIRDGVLYAKFGSKRTMGTCFAEIGGQKTNRLEHLAAVFKIANLPYEIPESIQAFHLSHAAMIAPIRHFYTESGMVDVKTAKSREVLHKLASESKQNIRLLEQLNIPIIPAKTKAITKLPNWMIILAFRIMLSIDFTRDVLLGNHAQSAEAETISLYRAFHAYVG